MAETPAQRRTPWLAGVHKLGRTDPRVPASLDKGRIDATECENLREVEPGLRCHSLDLSGTAIQSLPDDLGVSLRLDLSGCSELRALPAGLRTGSLVLAGCTGLEHLPDGLDVSFLDLTGCERLAELPDSLRIRNGRLTIRDCVGIASVPMTVGPLAQLDVAGCTSLAELPEGLVVNSWVDVGGSALSQLPASMAGAHIHWRGVPIDERIAFRPEAISGSELLAERNAERRRVMLERVGFERFLAEVEAETLHEDSDPGGPRRLLRVVMEGDEDLVIVAVRCPSTDRQFLLRVPPDMKSCHQAVAWTAGFDDPADYDPVLET